ncbi:cardiolipin synthase [Breznakiella homolactica]|uniref:Cardiolipin synthase n=1 Tax=Breznakiella homolactica TaxID=2798577 RepID=A0A7T8B949_9SPIR|nr:cardiolipin synthase [Breznakiella homolactica]QQO09274.1 cardiolipin synthase [Breznakiella homolactica]
MRKKWVRIVFRRRIFVIAILLAQIIFLLYLITRSSRASQIVSWILNVISILVCLYIVSKKEKPAYKLTWIFLILMFPIFGGLLYIFFYVQSNPTKMRRQIEESDAYSRPLYLLPGNSLPLLERTNDPCLPQVRYLQDYAGYPVYRHTKTEYFASGETFFQKVLEELEKAEKYIFMEFFILQQGLMLNPIIAILERKARQGADVRIMYDDLGCFLTLPTNFKQHLEHRGIKCIVFNPFTPILSSLQNNRDHRKIISIDGKVAFTGGINLADEYINAYDKHGHWKDAAIMLEGEAAWSLSLIFLQMWNLGQKEPDDFESFYPWKDEPCTVVSDGYVQPYADSPIDDENVGEHVYVQIINNAKDYVYINTPYLIVDDNLLSALTLSAKSGVDVRIITPYRWDKKIVHMTTRSYYRQLVKNGVKIYEYTSGFNHSKTFVSDDKVATVGTTNLDFRSLYLHFECGVWIYKNKAVKKVKDDFLATLPICHRITMEDTARNAAQRLFQEVLRLFAPLM